MINIVIRSPFNGDGSFSVPTFIILILHKFWLRCFYILNVITELNVSLAKVGRYAHESSNVGRRYFHCSTDITF